MQVNEKPEVMLSLAHLSIRKRIKRAVRGANQKRKILGMCDLKGELAMLVYLQMLETDEEKSKFEEIYNTYRDMMTGIAMQILGNEQDAQDAVHQAFLSIINSFKKISKMKCPDLTGYIVIIVKNKSIDILREHKRIVDFDYNDNMGGESFLEPGISSLTDSLARLPERYRTVLLLRYHYGFKTRELAEIYNLPQATIQKLIWRAKQALQAMLDGDEE